MTHSGSKPMPRGALLYGGLIAGVVVIYLAIRAYGDTLTAPAPANSGAAITGLTSIHVNDFVHVLLALTLVIAAARLLGAVFRWIQQPPVVGEMIAGIMLGPSLLGHLAPTAAAYVLPESIAPLLQVISQFGVVLYMFLVGLELDLSSLRSQARSTVMISHASIVAPFVLGSLLALLLYPRMSDSSISFTSFSLFIGVSVSVTAFPVLARILTDRRIHKTKMGTLTLACAAIDDVTAWCLLAFVVAVAESHSGSAVRTVLMSAGYVALMLLAARPLVGRVAGWIDSRGRLSQGILAFVLLGILLSALATESIGIHSIFGAFMLGAIIPHDSRVARELMNKLEDFVIVFLLPAFFAFTGLRTQIGLVNGWHNWLLCLLILAVASLGKFGGGFVAARMTGLPWREASAIGVLMNTRGLVELIVLNIGLELHVISPTLFAMLVLMALVTTLATTPILHFITPRAQLEGEARAVGEASRLAHVASERAGVFIPVSSTSAVAELIDLAAGLSRVDAPPPRVVAVNRGSATGIGTRVRDEESFALSRSPILAAALDAAWSRKLPITPQAIWAIDAAAEIVEAAERAQVRWLLLESQRSIFGVYPRRGVVNRVMEKAAAYPIHVAVLLPSFSPNAGPVTCMVTGADHGYAALELARCICENSQRELEVLAPFQANGEGGNARIPAWLRRTAPAVKARALAVNNATLHPEDVPAGLVVIAKDVAREFDLESEFFKSGRSAVLVQGAEAARLRVNAAPMELRPLPGTAG